MPAALHLLGAKPYPCGCGRTWGCVELYTTLAGLPYLLAEKLPAHPDHPLATSTQTPKEKALALRGLAQKGDPLAVELFDFQARAMGLHIANLVLALDPEFVVIGGGLMDPENTTDAFRARYLDHRARDGAPAPVAGAARSADGRSVDARRAVAGDRRRAGRAVSQPALSVPQASRRETPRARASRYRCVTRPT